MSLSQLAAAFTQPLWRAAQLLFRWVAGLLFVAWSLLLLAWLTLHWGILPHIDEWRPRVEALATRSLGVPVKLGRIEVRTGSWVPAAELRDVVLHDAQGRESLRLPRVTASLSLPALLALELRFDQLLIEGAALEVRRDAQGRLRVAGIDMAGGDASPANTDLTDWFFEQHEFVIRGSALRWVDELRDAPPLALADVQLVVRNSLRRHDVRLDATPPAEWGERFTLQGRFRQPLLARAGDFSRWSGTLHAALPHADVAALRRHVALPFDLASGAGALRAWLDIDQGRPRGATVDVALRDVNLRLARELEPLAIRELATRLVARRQGGELQLAAEGLRFATESGEVWPAGRIALALQQAEPGPGQALDDPPVTGGVLSADRLDVAMMADVAHRVPLSPGLRKLLGEMAPEGTVSGLSLRWGGPIAAPTSYLAKARLQGVSIASAASPEPGGIGRPGWKRADVELEAAESGGRAKLAIADGALEFPGVFDTPVVPLRRFDAQLQWRITAAKQAGGPPQVALTVKDARFDNDDMQGELDATWHTGEGERFGKGGRLPGVLDLHGKLSRGNAAAVARYLPLGLPQHTRDYVRLAVREGQVTQAQFKVRGDLWEFPFYNARDGEFRIAAQAQGVTLAYVPDAPAAGSTPAWVSPWPAFTQVGGELVFERTSMTIRNASGQLWGVALSGVNGGIRNLAESATLELDGSARGPAADLLRYVKATPIREWTADVLDTTSATGAAELKLSLKLPLDRLAQSTVKGSVTLAGNDLRLRADVPPLQGARGRVDFTQRGFTVVGGAARTLGGDATFDGGTQADGSTRFTVNGTASAEALRRTGAEQPALAVLARMGALAQGSAPYRLQIGLVKGWPEFLLTSSLAGMAVDLPAPLGKAATGQLPLRVQTTLVPDSLAGSGPARDLLRIDWGAAAQAQFQRELGDNPRVLRSAMALGAALPPAVAGGQAVIDADHLDLDAWRQAAARLPAELSGGGSNSNGAESGYLPTSVKLSARSLLAGGRRLNGLTVALQRLRSDGADTWRATLEAEQAAGLVEYREAPSARGAGRIYARLARLSLPRSEADEVTSMLDNASGAVPALDIVVDDFELRGKRLGRLEVQAVNRGVAAGDAPREWRLTELALRTPDAVLTGSGHWSAAPGQSRRRMVLDFKLDLADSGALLERLGFGKVMTGGKGTLGGQLQWQGSPLALDIPTLEGQMNLALERGRMLQADNTNTARLLGVLSLQSLPRRLLLDFRDVFQDGFAFDTVAGDMSVARGVAATRNLRLRGLQATVLMEGRADIGRETQDLRVYVVPEINAGAASLAYAAINPAIGLGTFVAQWLLRRPLIAANTREFHVTGAWDAPRVERVERQPGAPVPDTEPAAAAASMPAKQP